MTVTQVVMAASVHGWRLSSSHSSGRISAQSCTRLLDDDKHGAMGPKVVDPRALPFLVRLGRAVRETS